MSEIVQSYEDIVSIDKRIQALNQEVTHINKIIKHYNEYKKCLSADLGFVWCCTGNSCVLDRACNHDNRFCIKLGIGGNGKRSVCYGK